MRSTKVDTAVPVAAAEAQIGVSKDNIESDRTIKFHQSPPLVDGDGSSPSDEGSLALSVSLPPPLSADESATMDYLAPTSASSPSPMTPGMLPTQSLPP